MFVVTVAMRGPVLEGGVSMLTVSDVAVATVTEPTAPLSNVTVFADGTPGTKPVPLIVIRDASCERVAVLAVTVGAAIRPGGVTIRKVGEAEDGTSRAKTIKDDSKKEWGLDRSMRLF
jgi:hypothetical protein